MRQLVQHHSRPTRAHLSICFLIIVALVTCMPASAGAADPSFGRSNSVAHTLTYFSAGARSGLGIGALGIGEPVDAAAALRNNYGRIYPTPKLDPVDFVLNTNGQLFLPYLPALKSEFGGRLVGLSNKNEFVFYSIDPSLQKYTSALVRNAKAPHVAAVIMEPATGRILALAQKSRSLKNPSLHAGFPAASLFKIVTSAAVLERSTIGPYSLINFRGGNYTLNKTNYRPDEKRDKRSMSHAEALGRSCNPVFARLALKHLSSSTLRSYARSFGFNTALNFDIPVPESTALVPESAYELSRTAAGFGKVTLSPIHAAALIASVANGGSLPRPYLVDRIVDESGQLLYRGQPQLVQRTVRPETARTLMTMLEKTTTVGTSKHEFIRGRKPVLPNVPVSAKTGTLRGSDPAGLNKWFVAAAPRHKPEIALAVIVVNPGNSNARPARIGRLLLEKFFWK